MRCVPLQSVSTVCVRVPSPPFPSTNVTKEKMPPSVSPPVHAVSQTLSLPSSSLGNTSFGAVLTSVLTSDNTSTFSLSSSGLVQALWNKTGTPKTSFGDKGLVDTKSRYSTAMLVYSDEFGEGRVLTAGGFDVGSSTSNSSSDSPAAAAAAQTRTQGVVKHFDLTTGRILQTYMGGEGLVRCLAVPGAAVGSAVATYGQGGHETKELSRKSKDEAKRASKAKARNMKDKDDPYADDTSFRPNGDSDDDDDDDDDAAAAAHKTSATANLSNRFALRNFVSGGDDSVLRFYDVRTAKLVTTFGGDHTTNNNNDSSSSGSKNKAGKVGAMQCIATCEEREFIVVCGHRAASSAKFDGKDADYARTFTTPRTGDGTVSSSKASSSSSKGGAGAGNNSTSEGLYGGVRIWDVRMRELALTLPEPHLYETTAMSLSPDGYTLFTAGGGESGPVVKEWDLRMGAKIAGTTVAAAQDGGKEDTLVTTTMTTMTTTRTTFVEPSLITDNALNTVVAAAAAAVVAAPAPAASVVPALNLTPSKTQANKLAAPVVIAIHPSQITSLASIVTPPGSRNYVLSTSKSGLAYLHSTSRVGVVKSQAILTFENYSKENTYDANKDAPSTPGSATGANALEALGKGWPIDTDFRLVMKDGKVSKLDLRIVGSDRKVRSYDIAETIRLKTSAAPRAADSAAAAADDAVSSLNLSESKRDSKEDNYHRKQMEFWDNLPSEPAEAKSSGGRNNNSNNNTKSGAPVVDAEASLDPYGNPTHDEHGNKFGSIEYWVMKGEKPKRLKVGDLVVLAGENIVTDATGAAGPTRVNPNLPAEALGGSLKPNRYDIGVVTVDDQSGMPYEVFGAVSATKSWFEEAWIVAASAETITRIQALGGIDIERARAGERQRSGLLKNASPDKDAKNKGSTAADDDDEDEDVAYYKQMMLTGDGGHGGWAGAGEVTAAQAKATPTKALEAKPAAAAAEAKSVVNKVVEHKINDDDNDDDYRPASASGNPLPQPPVLTAEAKKAEEERQKVVQDSLDMYRKQKAAAAAAKGKK